MKNKSFLKEEYKLSWNYLKECKNYIWIIVGIFFVFVLIGYFIPAPESIKIQIMKFIQDIVKQTDGMSQLRLINFIFLNNFQSSFFGLILGAGLGIFPIFATVGNGYLLGFVGAMSVKEAGILSLWRIFPHGIFELPAVFISFGLGLKFGSFIFQKKKKDLFLYYLNSSLRVFVFIVVPLLIIAGIIEGSLIFLFG